MNEKVDLRGELLPKSFVKKTTSDILLIREVHSKSLIICLICCCLVVSVSSQPLEAKPAQIKVGSKVPEIFFKTLINFPLSSAKLSDFKGKPIILDFSASWCAPCAMAIPKMDSLQRGFGSKVQFLMVNNEGKEKAAKFIERIKQTRPLSIPVIVDDNTLWELFNVRFLPHYVWIDGKGIVRAITNQEQINTANVHAFINGNYQFSSSSKSVAISATALFYSSAISGYKDEQPSSCLIQPAKNDQQQGKIIATNCSVEMLFRIAFSDSAAKTFPLWKTILETKGNLHYSLATATAWDSLKQSATFCYELQLPGADAKTLTQTMRQDLSRFFPLRASLQQRRLSCLALVATGRVPFSVGGKSELESNYFGLKLRNRPVSGLIEVLQQYNRRGIIDRSGILVPVDVELKCALGYVEAVRVELARLGLGLEVVEEEMEVLVIED
ncbi:hypothetical protein C3K47_10985 [Solitalea longa]|uniref:Thioredoxin domain-containing protein n=1 Tax=Solitalea longa TaxID=2079460 RepID=A0A2S5A1Y5_9SPHI|nr:TlpA disulfide reductase family protein [Solitalea longa]POY36272.1 hypothetical protein C3K47_10985 [Solitalea longa]